MVKRGILVLDVDETLLNIEPLFFLKKFHQNYAQYNGKTVSFYNREYYIAVRPKVHEFLQKASENFDLVAFSIVDKNTTTQKLASLGLNGFFVKIYGQEDLIDNKKSLKIISNDFNTPMEMLTAIDNTPDSFAERDNIIAVKPFYIGQEEYEFQEHEDNLMGALQQALRERQALEVIPAVF